MSLERSQKMYNAFRARAVSTGSGQSVANRVGPSLLKKLTGLGASNGSVCEALNDHFSEQKVVDTYEVLSTVKEFRKFGKFNQALEVIEWMEMKKIEYSQAMRLDLIHKSKGISAAEDYMRNLPSCEQNRLTYSTLLNCYCLEAMEPKALEIFDEMSQLGFVTYALPFDNLMAMYLKMGNYNKVISLAKQMREKNIFFGTYTYNHLMRGFAGLNDIEAVERLMERIELADRQRLNWTTYNNLATIYMKAGLFERAKVALKKLEGTMKKVEAREAYHYLIRLHAMVGQPDEAWRVWELLNSVHPGFNNMSYLAILQALDKLDDLENLKVLFHEWQSRHSFYDIRLAHIVVGAYLRHDKYDEAVSVFEDARERTRGPFFKMREIFMFYFLENRRLDSALSYLELNVLESNDMKRGKEIVTAFLECFEKLKDVDGAERTLRTMRPVYRPDSGDYLLLLKIYAAAEKFDPEMRLRLEEDGVEISPEVEYLLQKIFSDSESEL